MFAPKSIEPQVPLCLTPPAVIDRIPEIPEKAPVRELDCTAARDRRCFLRRELQQNRAEAVWRGLVAAWRALGAGSRALEAVWRALEAVWRTLEAV